MSNSEDWSPVKPVTPEVKHICSQMKSQVESKTGVDFAVYIPIDFIYKDEEATNYTYVVKVDVGGEKCVHAMILQAGGGELNVEKTLYPKHPNEPPAPF